MGLNPKDDAFFKMETYVPHSISQQIVAIAKLKNIPVSRVIAIALDNELTESTRPFHLDTESPQTPFVEYAYAAAAAKIATFLGRVRGMGKDSLMLCRRDIGVESREVFLYAYRELLTMGIIEEYRPTRTAFKYGDDYRFVRLVGHDEKQFRKTKFKRSEGKVIK